MTTEIEKPQNLQQAYLSSIFSVVSVVSVVKKLKTTSIFFNEPVALIGIGFSDRLGNHAKIKETGVARS